MDYVITALVSLVVGFVPGAVFGPAIRAQLANLLHRAADKV